MSLHDQYFIQDSRPCNARAGVSFLPVDTRPFFVTANCSSRHIRKVRKSAKIFHNIGKIANFAKEKCGFPQKSFTVYGNTKRQIPARVGQRTP